VFRLLIYPFRQFQFAYRCNELRPWFISNPSFPGERDQLSALILMRTT